MKHVIGVSDLMQHFEDISTSFGSEYAAFKVFHEIARHHGREVAQKIFAKLGKKPGRRDLANPKEIKDRRLLEMYDRWHSTNLTAKFCAYTNKILAKNGAHEEQYGAGPANEKWESLERYLKCLLKERRKRIKGSTIKGVSKPF